MDKPDNTLFEFTLGGFTSGTRGVKLEAGILKYAQSAGGINDTVYERYPEQPSAEAIENFFASLTSSGVWKWKKRYDNREIMDGTEWELTLRQAKHKIKCYGSNAYPEGFDEFLKAINTLIGEDLTEICLASSK